MSEWCYSLSLSPSLSCTISQKRRSNLRKHLFSKISVYAPRPLHNFRRDHSKVLTHEDESILREREGWGHVFESSKITVGRNIIET